MNFTELCAEVYTITGRPDRVAETESAVKNATLKAHQSDFFYKDLFEAGLQFSASDYVQSLDYRAAVPRWRSLKYLRKLDYVTGIPGKFLEVVVPENVLDKFSLQKQDICYVAGAYVQINSGTPEQYYLLGCYLNPDITAAGYSSWIALDHPYAIIHGAAAHVFKAIGKDEEASAYKELVKGDIMDLQASNITAVGF